MTTLTAQAESLAGCMGDFTALIEATYDEVAIGADGLPHVPILDINVGAYLAADQAGLMSFAALRDDGRLVGAMVTVVHPELHHQQTLAGVTDCFVVTDGAQAGGGADVLRAAGRADLEARGVSRWFVAEHFGRPFPFSLHDHGFHPVKAFHALSLGTP